MISDAKCNGYLKNIPEKNRVLVGFANQKNQICFYCLVHEVMIGKKPYL